MVRRTLEIGVLLFCAFRFFRFRLKCLVSPFKLFSSESKTQKMPPQTTLTREKQDFQIGNYTENENAPQERQI